MSVIITAHVRPRAKRNALEWLDDTTVKIWVTEVAEKGKANKAVLKILAKDLGCSNYELEIVRGATTSIKHIKKT